MARTNTRLIHRHPLMYTPPPSESGDVLAIHHRYTNSKIRRRISTSSSNGRWDQMVLNQNARTGIPHTAVFKGVWRGWGITMRTVVQLNRNAILHFEKDYSSRSLIDLPPP